MEIKIRGISKATISKIDEKAKELGYKSRNEFLKTYLERQFLYLDKLVEYEGKYEILLDKVLKVLDYNTLALNKFCEENLIDVEEIVKEEKLVYTAQEVAKILHASPNYVYELIRKGKLKAFKLKSIRILKSALEDFIKQNEGNDLSDIDNVRRLSKYEDNER